MESLQKLYYVEYSTLNAADYGVPQTRKRLVLHGIRKDINEIIMSKNDNLPVKLLPQPTHSQVKQRGYKRWLTVGDSIMDLPVINAGESYEENGIKIIEHVDYPKLILKDCKRYEIMVVIKQIFLKI